jgi:hypothetical protein
VPTPADLRKQFIMAFGRPAPDREHHDVLEALLAFSVEMIYIL